MSSVVQDTLKDCSKVNTDILPKVLSQFDKDGFEYSKISDNEIMVVDKKKEDVQKSISSIEDIPNNQSKILLEVTGVKDKVYIKKKYA